MLSFRKITEFLRKAGSRDGGTQSHSQGGSAKDGLLSANRESVDASMSNDVCFGINLAGADGYQTSTLLLHGLPPNADTQAILLHIKHFVEQRVRDSEETRWLYTTDLPTVFQRSNGLNFAADDSLRSLPGKPGEPSITAESSATLGGSTAPAACAGARDVLSDLQRERAEMIDALDVCLQEIPEVLQPSPSLADSAAPGTSQTAAGGTQAATPNVAASAASRSGHSTPSSSPLKDGRSERQNSINVTPSRAESLLPTLAEAMNEIPKPSTIYTVAAAVAAGGPVEVFTMRDWRVLLLQVVNALASIDRLIYAEQCRRAAARERDSVLSSVPVFPEFDVEKDLGSASRQLSQGALCSAETTPAPDVTSGHRHSISDKRDRSLATEVHKLSEEVLSTACAIATWVILRSILHQHMSRIDGEHAASSAISESTMTQNHSAEKLPGVEATSSGLPPLPPPAAASAACNQCAQVPSFTPSTTVTRKGSQAHVHQVSIAMEWHSVVREIRLLLGDPQDGVAECILCASFLRDDGKELVLCLLQDPKPRSQFAQLTTRPGRIEVGQQASQQGSIASHSHSPIPPASAHRLSISAGPSAAAGPSPNVSPVTTHTSSPVLHATSKPPSLSMSNMALPASEAGGNAVVRQPGLSSQLPKSVEDDTVMDDLLAALEFAYAEGISKTWAAYLQESVLFKRDNCTRTPKVLLAAGSLLETQQSQGTSTSLGPLDPLKTSTAEDAKGHDGASDKARVAAGAMTALTEGGASAQRPFLSSSSGGFSSNANDPFTFCELATAFFFCSQDLTAEQCESLFMVLHNGIGPRLVAAKDASAGHLRTRRAGSLATTVAESHAFSVGEGSEGSPRMGVSPILPSGNASLGPNKCLSATLAPAFDMERYNAEGSSSHFVAATVGASAVSLPTVVSTLSAGGIDVAEWYSPQNADSQSSVVPVFYSTSNHTPLHPPNSMLASIFGRLPWIQQRIVERIINMSWSAALHKRVTQCLSARPPLLDTAYKFAQEERSAAGLFSDFRARQRALGSYINARLAAGKSQEALGIARKHFKNERKEWTGRNQTIFTAIWYLQSMVQLVRAQAACRAFGTVIETVQFVLPQASLCEQMLSILAPKPRGSFILRFGDSRSKLLRARTYLLKEIWRAHATFDNRTKAEKYFNDYVASLQQVRKRLRDSELFEAYMERGGQQMQRNEYGEAVALFKSAVELARHALTVADAASSVVPSRSSVPASPSHGSGAAATAATQSRFHKNLHLRVAGSGSISTGEEHTNVSRQDEAELELPWRVAESERMLALAFVTQAEHEVNVRERRRQLSHAVNNAYASQTSLQRWQAKGGTPKRMLTAVPTSLIVTCRALLLLGQPKKAALLLEPLIEDKPNSVTVRPPMWREMLYPTEDPLTAEDIVLRVDVNSVKIAVYQLYARCLSRFDGERALRAVDLVHTLLQDSNQWIRAVHAEVRGSHTHLQKTHYSSDPAAQQRHPPAQPQQPQSVPQLQQPHVATSPSASVTSRSAVLQTVPEISEEVVSHVSRLSTHADLGSSVPSIPPTTISAVLIGADENPLNSTTTTNGEEVGIAYRFYSPSPGATASVDAKAAHASSSSVTDACDSSVPPLMPSSVPDVQLLLESSSERFTAMRALRQGHSDIRKAFRDLEITSGDAFGLLGLWEDALEAFSNALVICVSEEEAAVAATAEQQRRSAGGSAGSSPRRSHGVQQQHSAMEYGGTFGKGGMHPLEPLSTDLFFDEDEEACMMEMDVASSSTTTKDLRAVLANEERMDYKEGENLVLSKLATVYNALGQPKMAIHYNKQVLDYATSNCDTLLEYNSMLRLARLHTATDAHEEAQDMWGKVSELARQYEDMEVSRETTRNIVSVQEASGMYLDVVTTAKELDKLASEAEGTEAAVDKRYALEALANAHLQLAQYDECLASLDAREKVQEKSGEWTGKLLHMRALAKLGKGEIAEAIKVLQQWSQKATHLKLWTELGKASVALAAAHASDGAVFKARRCHQAALKAFSQVQALAKEHKESVLESARWLVHYHYLSNEEVQVDASLKMPKPRAAPTNTDSGSIFSALLGSSSSFANDLHNDSGDLSLMLAEDEKKRISSTATTKSDADDFFGDAVGWKSFAGADMAAVMSGEAPAEEEDGTSDSTTSKASSGCSSSSSSATPSPPITALPATGNPPAEKKTPSVSGVAPVTSTGKAGAPPPTSLANVSICSRPAAAASGTDVLDPPSSAPAAATTGGGPGSATSSGNAAQPHATATTTTTTTITISTSSGATIVSGGSASGTGTGGTHAAGGGSSIPLPRPADAGKHGAASTGHGSGQGAAGAAGSAPQTTAQTQDEETEMPARVLTLSYYSAMETIEWSTQLLTLDTAALRLTIPYSPAEAVDFALLAQPRTTFVFFFAEYATESSSRYDVVIRPANQSFCLYRSAQVTTLKQLYAVDPPIALGQSDLAEAAGASTSTSAAAALPASHPFAVHAQQLAVSTADNDYGLSRAEGVAGTRPDSALEKRTLGKLYDLYDELWNTVDSGLARAHTDVSAAECVVIVADGSLLHVPFAALLPNPDGFVYSGCEAPLGARATVVVTPALAHFVRHTINRDNTRRSSHCRAAPLHVRLRTEKCVFFPYDANTSSSSPYSGEDGGGRHGVFSRANSIASVTREPVNSERTSTVLGSVAPAVAAALAHAPSEEVMLPCDTWGALQTWTVRHGCTRKELVQYFNDPTVSALMMLGSPTGSHLKVADGMIGFTDFAGTSLNRSGGAALAVQLRHNLDFVAISNDRSTPTTALEPGITAKLCMQLGCPRVLRVDLPSGSRISDRHKEFLSLYLHELQRVERWGMSYPYALALRQAIAASIADNVPVYVWSSFTLVGAP